MEDIEDCGVTEPIDIFDTRLSILNIELFEAPYRQLDIVKGEMEFFWNSDALKNEIKINNILPRYAYEIPS